jgi:hypothetical protein
MKTEIKLEAFCQACPVFQEVALQEARVVFREECLFQAAA